MASKKKNDDKAALSPEARAIVDKVEKDSSPRNLVSALEAEEKKHAGSDPAGVKLPRGYSRQVGSSLSYWTSQSVFGFFGHPEYLRLAEYERAMTTDETIGAGIEFLKLAILASMGPYWHPNPKVIDFVNENFARMKGSYKAALGELAISAIWAGFGVSETVYKPEAGKVWIDFIANYNPRTLTMYVNQHGQLTQGEVPAFNVAFRTGIWQDRLGGAPVQLPLQRCCLVSHNKRYNNYYGESAIKRIYKNWRLKEAVLEMWNVALDRYGTPVVYMVVPQGLTGNQIQDPSAPGGVRAETFADASEGAIGNIHTGTGLVVTNPTADPNQIKLGTLTTGNNFGGAFEEAIRYYNKMMFRGLLIPALLLNENERGNLGSGGATAIHFEVFKMVLTELYQEIIEPFVEQVLGPLIRINFGDPNPGRFEHSPWDPATMEIMANIFEKMVMVGAVDNTDVNDINMMRTRVGIDPMESDRAARLAEKNRTLALTPAHQPDGEVEVKTVTKSEPKMITGQKTQVQRTVKSGGSSGSKSGGSSGGSPPAPTTTTTTANQQIKKPLPAPPKPYTKTVPSASQKQGMKAKTGNEVGKKQSR